MKRFLLALFAAACLAVPASAQCPCDDDGWYPGKLLNKVRQNRQARAGSAEVVVGLRVSPPPLAVGVFVNNVGGSLRRLTSLSACSGPNCPK